MSEAFVELNNVSFSYGVRPELHDVCLKVQRGDFLAVIGPNGGGKTTLIKLILGLLSPDSGTIRVAGGRPGERLGLVGYVPQQTGQNHSFPATALEVVTMGLFAPGRRFFRRGAEDRRRALAALERLGLGGVADRRIGDLSGGQLQRVLIARALVSEPELMIFDEPTASLDTHAQSDFFQLLSELGHSCTIIVVSHDLLAVATHARRVACVNRTLHSHEHVGTAGELIDAIYSSQRTPGCPVEQLRTLPLQQEIRPDV